MEMHVNSSRALRIEPATDSPNIIGGFSGKKPSDGMWLNLFDQCWQVTTRADGAVFSGEGWKRAMA